jgi:hypothetical integral membrane protein (TIGR02206 family)
MAALALILLTRAGWLRAARTFEIALAATLLLQWPFNLWVAWHYETIHVSNVLPFHFCDAAALLGTLALLTHGAEVSELLWFWGLAGTLQGLITPSLAVDWPHPRFVMFFALHCGVVIAALQVVLGRGITPRRGAVLRAMIWLVVYGLVAGAADWLLRLGGFEANFGFLCAKPATASLFDHLGPWPWYLFATLPLAWVFFSILDLPFLILRRRRE